MILKSLTLTNFQLFSEVSIDFQTINIFSGANHDNQSDSGNGSGKSTLAKNAISFLLYGRVEEYNLTDLVTLGAKKSKVEGVIEHEGKLYTIIREIPTKIWIYVDDAELKTAKIEDIEITLNNDELKQKYLDSIFGDYKFFRMFRTIDKTQGLDLLNQGETAFRKTLMGFLEDEFSVIRQTLLDEKSRREQYNASKRPYPYYLSTNRKTVLDNGLLSVKTEIANLEKEIKNQQEIVNSVTLDISSKNNEIKLLNVQNSNMNKQIESKKADLKNYELKIEQLKASPEVTKIEVIDYETKIKKLEKDAEDIEAELTALAQSIKSVNKNIEAITLQNNSFENELKNNEMNVIKLANEVKGLEQITINTKCDKCGSVVSEEQRLSYKQEKENSLTDYLAKNNQLTDMIEKNKIHGLNKETIKLQGLENLEKQLNIDLNNLKKTIKEFIQQNLKQTELLGKREKEATTLDSEIEKYNQLTNLNKKEIVEHLENINTNNITIEQLSYKIEQLKIQVEEETSILNHYNSECSLMTEHLNKLNIVIMKLNESFKFSEYKYSKVDVLLYDEAKKTFDDFAASYIEKWLENLTVIINNLLEKVNIKAKFTNSKNFIEIEENGRQLKYNQLSSGQKTFVSSIFKLAILIYKEMTGIILMDEGLADIDIPNLQNFIEVIKGLPFQTFIVYQNIPEIEGVNHITIKRENNESEVV